MIEPIQPRIEFRHLAQGGVPPRFQLDDALPVVGDSTLDLYLNSRAFWRNAPAAVWQYRLGGYQVLKEWLSHWEWEILDRALSIEEVLEFTVIARRIVALRIYSRTPRSG